MRLIAGSWNPATISALAAIFGSLTGALASSVSAWITQRHQDRRDLVAKRMFHREQLFSDFISESARAIADAVQHQFQDPTRLTPTYALLSRIRLRSSTKVLASVEQVLQHIISTYSEPNLKPGYHSLVPAASVSNWALQSIPRIDVSGASYNTGSGKLRSPGHNAPAKSPEMVKH